MWITTIGSGKRFKKGMSNLARARGWNMTRSLLALNTFFIREKDPVVA
jgi:hypothetical protein